MRSPESREHRNDCYSAPGGPGISICLQGKAAGLLRPARSVRTEQADGTILPGRGLGHWSEPPGDQVIKFMGGRREQEEGQMLGPSNPLGQCGLIQQAALPRDFPLLLSSGKMARKGPACLMTVGCSFCLLALRVSASDS